MVWIWKHIVDYQINKKALQCVFWKSCFLSLIASHPHSPCCVCSNLVVSANSWTSMICAACNKEHMFCLISQFLFNTFRLFTLLLYSVILLPSLSFCHGCSNEVCWPRPVTTTFINLLWLSYCLSVHATNIWPCVMSSPWNLLRSAIDYKALLQLLHNNLNKL